MEMKAAMNFEQSLCFYNTNVARPLFKLALVTR